MHIIVHEPRAAVHERFSGTHSRATPAKNRVAPPVYRVVADGAAKPLPGVRHGYTMNDSSRSQHACCCTVFVAVILHTHCRYPSSLSALSYGAMHLQRTRRLVVAVPVARSTSTVACWFNLSRNGARLLARRLTAVVAWRKRDNLNLFIPAAFIFCETYSLLHRWPVRARRTHHGDRCGGASSLRRRLGTDDVAKPSYRLEVAAGETSVR